MVPVLKHILGILCVVLFLVGILPIKGNLPVHSGNTVLYSFLFLVGVVPIQPRNQGWYISSL